MFLDRNSSKNRSAARQGPRVWELEGPIPIFSISKTEIHSSIKVVLFNKYKAIEYPKGILNFKNCEFAISSARIYKYIF